MALVVEDGTGKADAESYVSVADCVAYAAANGLTFSDDPEATAEQALRRATAWIDATYRNRFPGVRSHGRTQALEWPRGWAEDANCYAISATEVPPEVVNATCEAAIRELAEPGLLSPDLERGGDIKRLKAGSVEIEYGAAAPTSTTFAAIDNALSSILKARTAYSGRAVRG